MHVVGNSGYGPLAKVAVTFPFVYHYFCGVRHLVWDRDPESLTTESVTKSSYILFGSAAAVSSVISMC